IVNFHPSFIESSTAILDLHKGIVVFKRFGAKKSYRFEPPTKKNEFPDIKEIFAMETVSFKLDPCDYAYIKDSLIFTDEDFIDKTSEGTLDGIGNSILYLYEDGKIQDIDLSNSFTENQTKLFTILIDAAIIAHPQNTYFRNLIQYYR
ncbi:MAG: hypothetical protein LBV75_04540, partial [Paludibacter sp.]|nr:hypothetical protein [Paludibacter sp.]